jgi:small subunit ribosomal protein S11
MGKKRIVETEEAAKKTSDEEESGSKKESTKSSKKRVESGILQVESTYNNTKLSLSDLKGNTLATSSSGALGFKGAKKGTPFAAAKVGETVAIKAQSLGMKEVKVVVKGVGSGRESAIRGFISKGINIVSIQDKTPVPHNGPRPPKPRRT